MPLDSVVIHNLAKELQNELAGSRIDKIYQPSRFDISFAVRSRSDASRLLISAGDRPRAYLTNERRINPDAAPMFCMLLRKHLTGARIKDIAQPGLERALVFTFECSDEFGEKCEKKLATELIGRYANVILIGDDGRIIDCMKRVDSEMSSERPVLPGLFYRLPPTPDKPSFDAVSSDEFSRLYSDASPDMPVDSFLSSRLWGLPPLICRELAFKTTGDVSSPVAAADPVKLWCALALIKSGLENGEPLLFTRAGEQHPFDFSFMPISQYGEIKSVRCSSFSAMLSSFYDESDARRRLNAEKQTLSRSVKTARGRLERKLTAQLSELEAARGREQLRRNADVLMANIYRLEKGLSSVVLTDIFEESQPDIEIKLDPRLSPHENARKYYREYTKMKNAEEFLTSETESVEHSLRYLDSVLDELARAENSECISDIRAELSAEGFIKERKTSGKQKKKSQKTSFSPVEYITSGGFTVLSGRNNRENEILTLKSASRFDIWFHVKNAPGSHVILLTCDKAPSADDMTDAAVIAAWNSSQRASALVPVDYTEVRNVKKLKGGGPGMVNYVNYKTAYITPDEALIKQMRTRAERRD